MKIRKFKTLIFIIVSFILFTCESNKRQQKLNNLIDVDPKIETINIKRDTCFSRAVFMGGDIKILNDDSSVVYCNAILRRNLLEINLTNCSGWVHHNIKIEIADSLFFINYQYRNDVSRNVYYPFTQELRISKYPIGYNDTISGIINFEGISLTEFTNLKTKITGRFSCIVEGDTSERYNSIDESYQLADYVYNLKFSYNKSDSDKISNYKNLKYLEIGNIDELPQDITRLLNLEVLDLSFNEIEDLPNEIGNLRSLKKLNLLKNNILKLPPGIANCKNLEKLSLRRNHNFDYKSIIYVRYIKEIDIGLNNLKTFPSEIYEMKNLEVLKIGGNDFNYGQVLKNLTKFKQLIKIELWNCELKEVPVELFQLKNLEEIDLRYNPLSQNEINKLKCQLPYTKIKYDKYKSH